MPLSFYVSDAGAKSSAYNLLLQNLCRKSPTLHDHLVRLEDHDPDVYIAEVFTGLFTSHLALDEAARLWDVYVFEGDSVLMRAAVALLLQKEMTLMGTTNIDEVKATLTDKAGVKGSRVVGGQGEEDIWMKAVKEAGKV